MMIDVRYIHVVCEVEKEIGGTLPISILWKLHHYAVYSRLTTVI